MARYLITSALPYINGAKHLGNLVGSMLPADVYARYLRRRGHEVLYLCATDEHGTPAELAALEAGLEVSEFCALQHENQARTGRDFHLSYDHFGRSSSPQNHELTQYFAARLTANGLLEERVTKQVYSPGDNRFLPDRYIIGTCPKCGYDKARGDQCESCTRLLEPTDLINARSAVSGGTDLEVRESRHLFLLQSRMADEIRQWVEQQSQWPRLVSSIALKWLDEGLRDRCITRDLKWGVPVNRPGFENKVFYVWFDAPIEYIAATKEWADQEPAARDWKSWWYAADDVTYVQFMAKDNVPFHTVSFPCTLLGSREPWKMADQIKGFNWLNYAGGKFSTSSHRGVFMPDALALLPADYWRYFLMANAPESNDSDFTWPLFGATVNKDLADTLGNFVNRVCRFTERRFGLRVPAAGEPTAAEREMAATLGAEIRAYADAMDALEFRHAMGRLRAIWALGNGYFDRMQPWQVVKTDPARAACVLRFCFNLIRVYAVLSEPIIPATSAKLYQALGLEANQTGWPDGEAFAELHALPGGHTFEIPEILFRKLTDDELSAWEARFAGNT